MWAGGFALWLGSWLEVSKSLTSGEDIKWPLEFLLLILLSSLKWWYIPLSPEQNSHHNLERGGLGETHALLYQNEHLENPKPKEKYHHLKGMVLTN